MDPRRIWELVAVIVAGALHILTELVVSPAWAYGFNIVAVSLFAIYLAWRLARDKSLLRAWGLRTDNFRPAALALSAFCIPATLLLYAYGWVVGTAPLPRTFWLILLLYPVWGLAQQFALQNLIARNLLAVVSAPVAHALATTTLFSVAHAPNYPLMALTFVAGFAFTLFYRRHPNLWAIGIAHGFLGALAYYLVLGEDPALAARDWLAGH